MKGVFRSQVTVDLQRAFDCLKGNDAERVVLGYVREQSWNRAIASKVKASDPWPDPLPAFVDAEYLGNSTGIRPQSISRAIEQLVADGILATYQGGLTINKHVDDWAEGRISRAALEYSRSAQAIPHPTAGHPVEYPTPADTSAPRVARPEVRVADADGVSDWTEEAYGFRIPSHRIRSMLAGGFPPGAAREALRIAFGRAGKRTAEGIASYALSVMRNWKREGKLSTNSTPQAARSPPTRAAPSQARDSKLSKLFDDASREDQNGAVEERPTPETQQSA